jgi:hypothetical protein
LRLYGPGYVIFPTFCHILHFWHWKFWKLNNLLLHPSYGTVDLHITAWRGVTAKCCRCCLFRLRKNVGFWALKNFMTITLHSY